MISMGKIRGYVLVLLVAIWATLPAFAGLCPKEIPPCCRGMREMCCMSGNAPAVNLCCHMQMPEAAATQAAVVNVTDHAWHEVSIAVVARAPMLASMPSIHERVEVASSPPVLLPRSHSILRI